MLKCLVSKKEQRDAIIIRFHQVIGMYSHELCVHSHLDFDLCLIFHTQMFTSTLRQLWASFIISWIWRNFTTSAEHVKIKPFAIIMFTYGSLLDNKKAAPHHLRHETTLSTHSVSSLIPWIFFYHTNMINKPLPLDSAKPGLIDMIGTSNSVLVDGSNRIK